MRSRLTAAAAGLVACLIAVGTAGAAGVRDPFLSAAEYGLKRLGTPDANLHLRFREQGIDERGQKQDEELALDLAADWAQARRGDAALLLDYRLERIFDIDAGRGTFVSGYLSGHALFRLLERQNRATIEAALKAAGVTDRADDGCDAETELGVVIGSIEPRLEVRVAPGGGNWLHAHCNGRRIGAVRFDPAQVAPPTLWPALADVFSIHPALLAVAAEDGRVPVHLEAAFHVMGREMTRSWDLIAAEDDATAYPLRSELRNVTATALEALTSPELVTAAQEALGHVGDRVPPTAGEWDAGLGALRRMSAGAAALALFPTLGMFPESGACASGRMPVTCSLVQSLGALAGTDAAVAAMLVNVMAQTMEEAEVDKVLAAMEAAGASPNVRHPALGASFAISLLLMPQAGRDKAASMGLPTDARGLMQAAIVAYPYNPGFWLDLGHLFVGNWDITTGLLLADIAASLPMPEAQRSNATLLDAARQVGLVRRDAPQFFLRLDE